MSLSLWERQMPRKAPPPRPLHCCRRQPKTPSVRTTIRLLRKHTSRENSVFVGCVGLLQAIARILGGIFPELLGIAIREASDPFCNLLRERSLGSICCTRGRARPPINSESQRLAEIPLLFVPMQTKYQSGSPSFSKTIRKEPDSTRVSSEFVLSHAASPSPTIRNFVSVLPTIGNTIEKYT